MMQKNKRLFCFGYGYVSDYLGHALQQSDDSWTLAGTTRDEERRKGLLARRIRTHIFDYDHPLIDAPEILNTVTHILVSTPPDGRGHPTFQMHAEDLLNLPNLEWVGYLSSTGVYGNRDGGEVTETSEIRPTSQRGSRRAVAEQEWMSLYHRHGVPVHIFRLSGIYGPGRSALDSARVGVARRIEKQGHLFNRIHVEDIVQVLKASFEHPKPGSFYNLADDHPSASHEVIAEACNLLGIEVPPLIPYEEADMAPITESFYKDNKVVNNQKIKTELGVALKYPNYRVGLMGCLAAEEYALSQELEEQQKA